jgi:hypothetical protein
VAPHHRRGDVAGRNGVPNALQFGLHGLGEIDMALSDDRAYGVTAFALSWAVALTLVKTKQISKEDLLTTLQRMKAGPKGYAVDELINLVGDIKIGEGN